MLICCNKWIDDYLVEISCFVIIMAFEYFMCVGIIGIFSVIL